MAYRVLVLQLAVRSEPLRWDSWVQDIGPPETSQPHIIWIGEISSRALRLNAQTQFHPTANKLQCWRTQTTTKTGTQPHPLAERLPKIILSSQTFWNTPMDMALPTRKTRSSSTHQNTGTSPLHQEAYMSHWTNLTHWGQTPKTMGTMNLQPVKRRPQTQ